MYKLESFLELVLKSKKIAIIISEFRFIHHGLKLTDDLFDHVEIDKNGIIKVKFSGYQHGDWVETIEIDINDLSDSIDNIKEKYKEKYKSDYSENF